MGKKFMQGTMTEKKFVQGKSERKKIHAQDGPHLILIVNQNYFLLEKCSKMHQMTLGHV